MVPSGDPYDLQTCYEDYYYEQYQDKVHTYRLHQMTNTNELLDDVKPEGVVRPRKKYPVTVKTPKLVFTTLFRRGFHFFLLNRYVSKNSALPSINKRASVLCVPVITQPDPPLNRKRSKTTQVNAIIMFKIKVH